MKIAPELSNRYKLALGRLFLTAVTSMLLNDTADDNAGQESNDELSSHNN